MDKHLSELYKVAVVLVVDLDGAPRVGTSADLTAVCGGDDAVGTDDGKRDFLLRIPKGLVDVERPSLKNYRDAHHDRLVFCDSLLVLILVDWRLEDVDIVVGDVIENLEGRSFPFSDQPFT